MVIQVDVLWISSSFPSHFFFAVFKERFDTYATRSWKIVYRESKTRRFGENWPTERSKPKMRWVISTLASEMFSVFGLGLDSWTFHGRTEHQILQSATFPKPNRTLHEHCCCTFRKSRQICQRTPTFLRKHVWYVPEFMRDMCTAVHSKQLIFNF